MVKPDGPVERYYSNGELWWKGTYKDGVEDGPFESYHDNGRLMVRGFYKHGNFDGPYELYHENGRLKEKGTYKDGKACGEWLEAGETVTYPPCSDRASTSQPADEGTEEPFVFGGSLMNGLDIEILDYADPDPPLSEEEKEALWEVSTPYYLLEECSSVDKETLFETEVPLYSDEYHEYTVSDLGKFGRELGKIIRQKLEENSER